MELLYKISNTLYEGEFFVTPVLLIMFLVFKRRIAIVAELLVSYNYLKLFLIALSFAILIVQLAYLYFQSKNNREFTTFQYRISGPYSWSYMLMFVISIVLLILLYFKRWRLNPWFAFAVFFFSNTGLWMERLVIFITSIYRDYLPSSWGVYYNFWQPFAPIASFLTAIFLIYILRKSRLLVRARS
ncbi:hypothetical protein PDL71_04830 [Lacibacter sp. MH-610]|uniref:hypothetical protein n=1 Tax=Lacibacter sp. MH-610 TaxID=3020883 RepID=UPI003892AFCF